MSTRSADAARSRTAVRMVSGYPMLVRRPELDARTR
jgi:hypothetical protein